MRSFEFSTKSSKNGDLTIPQDIKSVLKNKKSVRVILLFEDEQSDWQRVTQETFRAGYSQRDAAYDQL